MKTAIYLCVLLIYGCSAKRKLIESSVVNKENVREDQTLQTKNQQSLIYSLSTDSNNQTNFLKLYPKGDFAISKDGFKGSADSLIWYNNMQLVNRNQQLQLQTQDQSNSQVVKQVATQSTKENKKALVKVDNYIWYALGGIAIIGFVFAARRMIRKV